MPDDTQKKKEVTFHELVVSAIAANDALAKLLIGKGIITQDEFNSQLKIEWARYVGVVPGLVGQLTKSHNWAKSNFKSAKDSYMTKLFVIGLISIFLSSCAAVHSPYDLHTWCHQMGSSRLSSIGPTAHDPETCERELEEDLADSTPRILYVPRDVVMSPVIAARGVWVLLGLTRPPF